MRKVLFFLFMLLSAAGLICAPYVLWEFSVPFETESEGPVSLDVTLDGDIIAACYTNGPNEFVWDSGGDSLISSPDTKVIRMNYETGSPEILEVIDYGNLFNNGIKGAGFTDNGFTLSGNKVDDYFRDGVLFINFENSYIDTTEYIGKTYDQSYYTGGTKPFYDRHSASLVRHSGGAKSSYSETFIIGSERNIIFSYDPYSDDIIPDSVSTLPLINFGISDFDIDAENNLYICGIIELSDGSDFRTYYMKLDQSRNVVWAKFYYYSAYPPAPHYTYLFHRIAFTSDGGCILGAWVDEDRDFDFTDYENYIVKCDNEGNFTNSIGPYNSFFSFLYRTGGIPAPDSFIFRRLWDNNITGITWNGINFEENWAESFEYSSIVAPMLSGFVSAGVKDNSLYFFEYSYRMGNIEDSSPLPDSAALYQNYPNPFNPVTEISFSIPETSAVNLSVFDTTGRLVRTLVNEKRTYGRHTISFDGSGLNSGIYFYRLQTDGRTIDAKRMLLIK
ncbi:MAG: T9SS type A sorting domain-containing protein [Candidatus Delongbacteria bacterium]|nr:T9SS type A sorting domain-containing protein [Candidatus Delongbacteria bacterium]